jgi:hypothetical protein
MRIEAALYGRPRGHLRACVRRGRGAGGVGVEGKRQVCVALRTAGT